MYHKKVSQNLNKMVNKSTTNVSTNHQRKNGGHTVPMIVDGGNKNSSDLALKTGYQRPSSREDIDNSFLPEQTFCERLFSWRSFIIVLLHFSCVIHVLPMVTMAMSLMCMCGPIKEHTNATLNNSMVPPISTYTEFTHLENITLPQEELYEFNWDSETQGLLITGYMFSSFMAPALSNIVRNYIGNKLTLTFFSAALAICAFVSPIAARTNVYFFLTIRILSGFCINTNLPVSVDTLAWWMPAKEKLTSTTLVISGWMVGGTLGPVITGYFCSTGVDNGWPLIFYFQGVLISVWTIVWYCLSSQKPEGHSYISEKEKTYIIARRIGMNHVIIKGADSTPYRKILTSRPVLAFITIIVFHNWALSIVITCLPLYLSSVLKFSLEDAGSVFSVIYFFRLPGVFLWATLGNCLLNMKVISRNLVRKICFGLGQTMAAIFFIGASFLDESYKWLASVMLGAAVVSVTFGSTMSKLIPLDMAPRYAGFISGTTSSVSGLIAITAPLTATAVTKQGSFEQWRVVLICMGVVDFMAGLVFLIFGNASQQPWAVPESAPLIVRVHDQSSSDQERINDSLTASLRPH